MLSMLLLPFAIVFMFIFGIYDSIRVIFHLPADEMHSHYGFMAASAPSALSAPPFGMHFDEDYMAFYGIAFTRRYRIWRMAFNRICHSLMLDVAVGPKANEIELIRANMAST